MTGKSSNGDERGGAGLRSTIAWTRNPPTAEIGVNLVAHEFEEAAIIESFFAAFPPKPDDDYYSHLMVPNESSKMHIVLDMHCKTVPTIEPGTLDYEVFKVKKHDKL